MIIIRFETQEMRGHESIMIDIITFFIVLIFFSIHISEITFGPIRDAADA